MGTTNQEASNGVTKQIQHSDIKLANAGQEEFDGMAETKRQLATTNAELHEQF